ncbi:XRE family transcriptional regulator [Dactylosporangium vinaceum]|uniref:XRE family transcriptional regulator n=1 Tax=Dactylosporangium vinaceum TaxID=53362 RepID=A0ABV5LZ49_9ACTN|nr:XRE family transcriptional regulator [Dactylosporangium vinaceum]UAB95184.1 XRE family transcriptional regulator [Dactylosporangium vinaceum]
MRHPLTRALAGAGLDGLDVASRLGVDPKTVDRWFAGRVPYPRHRNALSRLTGWPVADLWPDTAPRETQQATDEVVTTYANRSLVPTDTWRRLFRSAEQVIDIVVYSALFILEDPVVLRAIATKARAGVPVRIALGDPHGIHVARRGTDEGLDDALAARIRNAFVPIKLLTRAPNVQVRLHDTVLYNSIYRADDDVFANIHVQGTPAAYAPVLHLHREQPDGMTKVYLDAIERVWTSARPLG